MPFSRLPETTQTLYAELLDQLVSADAADRLAGAGSFVSKEIGGARYWYAQRLEGDRKRQVYLGRETPQLLETIARAKQERTDARLDERRRRELVGMLAAGGMPRESAAVAQVLRILRDAQFFRSGGVLVGTQAFTCIGNVLGVHFEAQTLRTADVDVAHDPALRVALDRTATTDLLQALQSEEPRFVAVPELDPREPSTSFKVRGRDLRVDFLAPARRGATRPIPLPHIGAAAQPVAGLDYLIAVTTQAAVLSGGGILVNIPHPGRFALHKLWVAAQRPPSEAAKRRKDLRQAEQILEVLIADDPGQFAGAWRSLPKRMASHVRRGMDTELRERVGKFIANEG